MREVFDGTIWEYDFRKDKSKTMFIWLVFGIMIDGSWELRGTASTESIAKAQSKMLRSEIYPDPRIRRVHIEKVMVDHLYGGSMLTIDTTPQIMKIREEARKHYDLVEKEKKKFLENVRKRAKEKGIL